MGNVTECVTSGKRGRREKCNGIRNFSLAPRNVTRYIVSIEHGDSAMHGTIQTPKPRYDRAEVARHAWKLWKLAQDVAKRGPHDHFGIMDAVKAAGGSHQAQIDAVNADYGDRQEVKGIMSFGDAMRIAWGREHRRIDNIRRAEEARVAATCRAPITGFDAERYAANCLPFRMESTRRARLADIDRREAAARAIANAH